MAKNKGVNEVLKGAIKYLGAAVNDNDEGSFELIEDVMGNLNEARKELAKTLGKNIKTFK